MVVSLLETVVTGELDMADVEEVEVIVGADDAFDREQEAEGGAAEALPLTGDSVGARAELTGALATTALGT